MITTLNQVNEELQQMDEALARVLATGDTAEYYQFNVSQAKLDVAINGNYRGVKPIHPTITGHLHVKKEYEYLLNSIK